MSKQRRSTYQRLLRWYPVSWRRVNGAVVLDTLEEHADAQGHTRPTRGEAWSIRSHGLAERATPTVIVWVACVALLMCLVPAIMLVSGAAVVGPWMDAARVTVQFLGALLVSVAAGAMLVRAGVIHAEAALVALAAAVPAWLLGALTVASWSVGFDEADAGATRSWFGSATGTLLICAWAVGAAALLPVAFAMLGAVRSRTARITSSAGLSVTGALALGVTAATFVGLIVGAAAVLIVASIQLRGLVPARAPQEHERSLVLTPTKRRIIVASSAAAAVLGVGCAVFALTGSSWAPAVGDSTTAMRVGILAGALVAIVTVGAGAAALLPRMGRIVLGPALALVAALLALASSYILDETSPLSWPLHLAAGVLTGLAVGLMFAPMLPGARWFRILLIAAISVAAAISFGFIVITAAAFLAPAFAILLTVVLLRRPILLNGTAAVS